MFVYLIIDVNNCLPKKIFRYREHALAWLWFQLRDGKYTYWDDEAQRNKHITSKYTYKKFLQLTDNEINQICYDIYELHYLKIEDTIK